MKRTVVVEDFRDFLLPRAFAALPQQTSENCVGYGALFGQPCVVCLKHTIATVSLVRSRHDKKTSKIVDNFQFIANKVLDVIFTIFVMSPLGCFLKILLDVFLLLPLNSISWRLWWCLLGHQQQVFRKGTKYGLCNCCLGHVQIYVCVSRLVCLLSVSKFSLHQSVSTLTKSLCSPAGTSCHLKKKLTAVCSYQARESCTRNVH